MSKFSGKNTKAAKLGRGDVVRMRKMYAEGEMTQGELGKEFGVSTVQVGRIVRGESWADAEMPKNRQESEDFLMRMVKESERVQVEGGISQEEEVKRLAEMFAAVQVERKMEGAEILEGIKEKAKGYFD